MKKTPAILIAAASILASPAFAESSLIGSDQLSAVLTPILQAVAAAAASVIITAGVYAVAWLRQRLNLTDDEARKLGLEIDAQHRATLQTALTNAAGVAINKLGNEVKSLKIDVRNPAIADAVNHALAGAPEALRYFGLDKAPEAIAKRIIAKIPQVLNTTTSA